MIRKESLEITYELNDLIHEEAWLVIKSVLEKYNLLPNMLELVTDKVRPDQMIQRLRKRGKPHFNISCEGFNFDYGSIPNINQIRIFIVEEDLVHHIDWDDWVQAFLNVKPFVQAWIIDREYDEWQNVKNPLTYKYAGKDCSHLPLISNGLPYPVEMTILDISKNPGRYILKDEGYVEAVGSTMWFGETFWELVGQDRKQAILSAPWANVQELNNGILRVQVAPICFIDESNADLQNQLRATLYGTDDLNHDFKPQRRPRQKLKGEKTHTIVNPKTKEVISISYIEPTK